MQTPPMLSMLVQTLRSHRIPVAVGGSALLAYLGMPVKVNDLDLTTDVPERDIRQALAGFPYQPKHLDDSLYNSEFCYSFVTHQIELVGSFSIRTSKGTCWIPTRREALVNDIPMGSPEAWYVAYSLMNRTEKRDWLHQYLREQGARTYVLDDLLRQPLPDDLAEKLRALPRRS